MKKKKKFDGSHFELAFELIDRHSSFCPLLLLLHNLLIQGLGFGV